MASGAESVKDAEGDARRARNLERALAAAWHGETLTSSALMALLPATRVTSLAVCEELVSRGWLEELPELASGTKGGRPARRFALRADAGLAIGIDAGAHALRGTALDAAGATRATLERRIDASADPEERIGAARALVRDLVEAAGAGAGAVLAITVGVPAPVAADGSPAPGVAFWERMNPGYVTALADLAPLVRVENDANAAAVAEAEGGAGDGSRSFACLLAGERLGAGIIADGRLVHGHFGLAGELGVLDLVEGVGSSVGFGVLAAELAARSAAAGVPPMRADGTVVGDAEGVLLAADEGDAEAQRIVRALGDRLARVAAVLAGVSGAERVVLGGALAATAEPLLASARAAMAAMELAHRPGLVASALGAQAVTTGAARHALDGVRRHALTLRPAAR